MLLALKADIRITSNDGETVLDKALRSGHRRLGVLVYRLFVKHKNELLADGRSVETGTHAAMFAAPSYAPTNMHHPSAALHSLMEASREAAHNATARGPAGVGRFDARNMWRPLGWSWKDIEKQRRSGV